MSLALNEDNSHFFYWHESEEMTVDGLHAWLDQYGGTQVADLVFCCNSQRSSIASRARLSVWDGFDPARGNDQPFFAGMRDFPAFSRAGARASMRVWVEHTLLLHQRGIDPYAQWALRSRVHGIHPWLSMRMNDVHCVDEPQHPIHDGFWKAHPDYRRDPEHDPYNGQCLDYGRPEVRAYQLAYAQELISAHDMDGFELDWMRNPWHFRPGSEQAGCEVLTDFVAQIRKLLDQRQREVGHPIRLGVRVPSRPETAVGLGMDAPTWARRGLVDKVVATPFLFVEFDIPIERWRKAFGDANVTLAAGLELTIRPYEGARMVGNNRETLRGAASSLLDRGADQIYLFNYMDNYPEGVTGAQYRGSAAAEVYRRALREAGSLTTMAGKSRRHIVAFSETKAAGEQKTDPLPRLCAPGQRVAFRLPTGPAPSGRQQAQARFLLDPAQAAAAPSLEVFANGKRCSGAGSVCPSPDEVEPLLAFAMPAGSLRRGENLVEVLNASHTAVQLVWVEVAVSADDGQWPSSEAEIASIYPGLPTFKMVDGPD